MAKKILIIGAGFLQDFVICKAKNMGYEVYAVDGDENAIGFSHCDKYKVIDIVDKQACLEFAKENNVNGVLTAATDFGVLTAAYIAEQMDLPGISYKTAELIKNKYLVKKRLIENNVDDTKQTYEVNDTTNIEELKNILSYPVMVKPCDGSGSRGASKVEEASELEDACKYAMDGSITHRAEIETFINGKEYGAESFVINGEAHVLGIMKKWMTNPPYYAELGHAIPSDLKPEIEQKAIQCVKKAIEVLGIESGSVNMDMLITNEGNVHIVDIGARMGGNMIGPCVIPYGTGIDYMAAMIQNAVSDEIDLSIHKHTTVATKLLAFEDGTIKQLPDFDKLQKEYDVEIYHHMKVGDIVKEYHTNLDGCGYIIAKADSINESIDKVNKAYKYISEYIFS